MSENAAPGQIAWTVLPRAMGGGRSCVIRDPAGAVCALYQNKA